MAKKVSEAGMNTLLAHLTNLPLDTEQGPGIQYPFPIMVDGQPHSHETFIEELTGTSHATGHEAHNLELWLGKIGLVDNQPDNTYKDFTLISTLLKDILDHKGPLPTLPASASPFYYGYRKMKERNLASTNGGISYGFVETFKDIKTFFAAGNTSISKAELYALLKLTCERILPPSSCTAIGRLIENDDSEEIELFLTTSLAEVGY